jgi:hypothetical protein
MPIILNGTTGEVPATWTTAGRPSTPSAGQTGYNSTLATLERYNGTSWGPIVTTSDSGTVTTSMLASGAITRAILPTGSILQVVSVNKNDQYSTTSTSYVTVTGLSTSITPTTATSKILVIASIVGSLSGTTNDGFFQLVRGSTAIGSTDVLATVAGQATVYVGVNWCYAFLDSPATTSSTTYAIQGKAASGNTLYVNRRPFTNDFTYPSSVTLIEVAA